MLVRLALAIVVTIGVLVTWHDPLYKTLTGSLSTGWICDDASIEWQGFTSHARLNPEAPDAQIIHRSRGSDAQPIVQSTMRIKRGEEEVIVVRYDIRLTHDDLHDLVELKQEGDRVALIVRALPDRRLRQQRCIKIDGTVSLPRHVNALDIDLDQTSIALAGHLAFGAAQIRTTSGSIQLSPGAVLKAREATLHTTAGAIKGQVGSTIRASQTFLEATSGSISGHLTVGRNLTVITHEGSLDLTLASDDADEVTHHMIDASTRQGSIRIDGVGLLKPFNLAADTRQGGVSGRFSQLAPAGGVVDVALGTRQGSLRAPSAADGFVVDKQSRADIQGHYGSAETDVRSSVRLSACQGSVSLGLSSKVSRLGRYGVKSGL